jgi:uncharacterized protein involved in exopolysaccharide biosynthesis
MKKLLPFLVWLYPRHWRERYEAEFHALLGDTTPCWKDAFDIAKEGFVMQFRTGLLLKPLAFGLGAALVAGLVLQLRPATYESQAVISVQVPEFRPGSPSAVVQSLAQRAFTSKILARVMETFHLYEQERAQGQTDKAVEKMRKGIRISSLLEQPTVGFISISYHNPDPKLAQQVTQDLVSRFIDQDFRRYEDEVKAALAAGERPVVLPATLELISPASQGRRPAGPNSAMVIGIALAEGSQLGLIFALLRRRMSHSALGQHSQ